MINRFQDHLLIIPEDDANRQIAIGFLTSYHLPASGARRIEVRDPAGGWGKVFDDFDEIHVHEMEKYPHRYMVLLIDFDGQPNRRAEVRGRIPPEIIDRVFILGTRSNPESLRREVKLSFERIGEELAKDCSNNSNAIWGHALLQDNLEDVIRLREHVRSILFADS
jgi:hypothetical protein